MRIIWAEMTQVSVITGMANTFRSWPRLLTSLASDRAGSQRSHTAKTSTEKVAIMNSGTEITETTVVVTAVIE